jgi:CRISPR type I-E-associated protein CasB/Cse2
MSEKKTEIGAMALSMAGRIASDHFSSGYRATLRRIDPTDHGSWSEPAVQRLLVQVLPDEWTGTQVTRDWGLLAHLLAIAATNDLQSGGSPFGTALQKADYSESRLMRLLDADRDGLDVLLPRAIRFLVAKSQSLSPPELIRFIRSVSGLDSESVERSKLEIARTYYRAARDTSTSSNTKQAEVA